MDDRTYKHIEFVRDLFPSSICKNVGGWNHIITINHKSSKEIGYDATEDLAWSDAYCRLQYMNNYLLDIIRNHKSVTRMVTVKNTYIVTLENETTYLISISDRFNSLEITKVRESLKSIKKIKIPIDSEPVFIEWLKLMSA